MLRTFRAISQSNNRFIAKNCFYKKREEKRNENKKEFSQTRNSTLKNSYTIRAKTPIRRNNRIHLKAIPIYRCIAVTRSNLNVASDLTIDSTRKTV